MVLKWGNYGYGEYNGFYYTIIKGDFLVAANTNYTVALVQSDDEGIGIVIAMPSTSVSYTHRARSV